MVSVFSQQQIHLSFVFWTSKKQGQYLELVCIVPEETQQRRPLRPSHKSPDLFHQSEFQPNLLADASLPKSSFYGL